MKYIFPWEPMASIVDTVPGINNIIVYYDAQLRRDIDGNHICAIGHTKNSLNNNFPWMIKIYKEMNSTTGTYVFSSEKLALEFIEAELKRLNFKTIEKKHLVLL